jgi:hypothetical protein
MNSIKRRLDKLTEEVNLRTCVPVIFAQPGRDYQREIEVAEKAGQRIVVFSGEDRLED